MIVELLEYVTPKGKAESKLRPNDVGNVHVCFEVDDIEEAYERLTAKGIKFAGRPPFATEGEFKGYGAIYLWDPDGINLELVQKPKGQ